ncbi:MAG: hypothetical protein ACRCXZ_08070 [Patescibacteria group bacterium]
MQQPRKNNFSNPILGVSVGMLLSLIIFCTYGESKIGKYDTVTYIVLVACGGLAG